MDSEDKAKLDRVLKLAEENNAYIRKVRSTQKTSQMIKAIYWVVIIVFVLGGFYFLQPYLNTLTSIYTKIGGKSTGTSSGTSSFQLPDAKSLQDFVNQIKQQ